MIFELFGCIWDCLVAFQYSVQNGSNWCKSSCHEVALEFFATNAPDPPLWILNSCSGVFQTNFAAFGIVCWLAKTRCKTGRQVQKFVLPSRIRILHNKHTQSSELDPKLLFSCVLFYLGAFGTVWLPYSVQNRQNWCTSSCHEVESEFFEKNATDPPPLDPKLMFFCISYYLGAFGTVWLCYNT